MRRRLAGCCRGRFVSKRCAVFHVGAVAILHDLENNKQRCYTEHTAEICAMAVDPIEALQTSQSCARLVCTAQLSSQDAVHVWGVDDCMTRAKLTIANDAAVQQLSFTADGPPS